MKPILKELLSPIPLAGIIALVFLLTLSAKGAGVLIAEQVAEYNVQARQ